MKTCIKCSNELPEHINFCGKCGQETPIEEKPIAIIKCGNCEYIGQGELARSTGAIILAWLGILLSPLITIIYFVATHKYKCPKCKSTFLGIKNKEGVYMGQRGGAGRTVTILICVIVGIAIIGILASVVLASLNSARSKGQDASIKANLSSLRAQAELYWDSQSKNGKNGNYSGLCNNSEVIKIINSIPKVKNIDTVCNDSNQEYVITSLLNSGNYWCVDNLGTSKEISEGITNQTSCSFTDSNNISNMPLLTGAEICARDVPNSTWDGKSYTSNGSYQCDCKKGYQFSPNSNGCKSLSQLCSEAFLNTYSKGIDPFDGKNTCDCKAGYFWNSERTACY